MEKDNFMKMREESWGGETYKPDKIDFKGENKTKKDSAIPLMGIYPKKPKTTKSERHMHPYVHCSITYNSQDTQAT